VWQEGVRAASFSFALPACVAEARSSPRSASEGVPLLWTRGRGGRARQVLWCYSAPGSLALVMMVRAWCRRACRWRDMAGSVVARTVRRVGRLNGVRQANADAWQ